MAKKKRLILKIIVISDSEDNSSDEDYHQSHPKKKPRLPTQTEEGGFQTGIPPREQDLYSLPSYSDDDICSSGDTIIFSDDEEEVSTHENDRAKKVTTAKRGKRCNIENCFLEDITHPTSPYVTNFQETKQELVTRLYSLYNLTVFNNQLPENMKITWSKRLRTTSGRCLNETVHGACVSSIELAEKVTDSAERVRDVLLHELCHAAAWLCDGVQYDDHGPAWKHYVQHVKTIHPELPPVTEYHSYTINYPYNYECKWCDYSVGRFTKIAKGNYCIECGGELLMTDTNEDLESDSSSSHSPSPSTSQGSGIAKRSMRCSMKRKRAPATTITCEEMQ